MNISNKTFCNYLSATDLENWMITNPLIRGSEFIVHIQIIMNFAIVNIIKTEYIGF